MIVPKNVSLCLTALAGLICLAPDNHVAAEGPALASLVKYNRDVRPILSENCFFCHGFDQGNRQADLRLDTQEGATADLGDHAAIVPGDPKNSELLTRIFTDDPDLKMPPADSVYALTDQQRETLRRWIEQGAHYEKHWAFRALQKPDVPEDKEGLQAQEGLQAIDAFLQQTWSTQNITPVAQASPRELIRRLSYDLRGLPPTLQEVRHFEADPSDQAFNALVEKWIDSLQYAEHQAVRWLDLVRWADSSGMVSDEPIASGAYRAYVIGAFQHNMPFDQFTIEQLAGDLLPEPTDQTLIASGYNRLVKTNSEAGVIDQEALYALKGEHVRALGTVWLGSTTGCAECHDHKYDPFTAKDYYSLAAFFDDLAETGVYMPGDRRVPLHYVYNTPANTEQDAQLTARVAEIYADIHREDPTLDAQQPDWETLTITQLQDKKGRSEFLWYPAVPPPSRIIEGKFAQILYADRPARVVSASPDEFRRHLITESFTGFLSQDRLQSNDDAFFVDVYLDPDSPPKQLVVQILRGAYGRKGWLTDYDETYYWGEDPDDRLQQKSSWHNPEHTKRLGDLPPTGVWTRLRISKQKLLDVDFYKYVGMAWGQIGGTVAWADSGLQLRTDQATSLRLAETPTRKWEETPCYRDNRKERMQLPTKALLAEPSQRSPLQQEIIRDCYREQVQPKRLKILRDAERELYNLRRRSTPVLVSRAGKPKQTRLVARGNFMDLSGPIVEPAIPEFLGKLPTDGRRANRLDLARWLVSNDNPLTPRVFVNRLWHQFYGRGLSETLEDSGGQGDWPSHPELLDWLAAEFRDNHWDRNHLVKLLVSAKAYRLSSRPTASLTKNDPSNRLHARQSRHRLTAEEIRDSALQAAGLLRPTITIPTQSFFPYQPEKYWKQSSKIMWGSRHMAWETSPDDHQYQRTVYSFLKRQTLHPTLLAFDTPTRQECTACRNLTNTPGQALALLNDPIFVEAARGLAERILTAEELPDDDARLRFALQQTLQRQPSAEEAKVLSEFLRTQRDHYNADPQAAQKLLAVGQKPLAPNVDPAELAAWTSVARSLLNLHEFLTRS